MKKIVLAIMAVLWAGVASAQTYTWEAQPGYAVSIQSQINALKAQVPPLPSSVNMGQFLVGNAAGTALIYAPISGDCASSSSTPGSVICTKSGGTALGAFATANPDGSSLTIIANVASVKLVPVANGGTSATTAITAFNNLSPLTTFGDIIYEGNLGSALRLPGNTTSNKRFLTQTGTGSGSASPTWAAIASADLTTALTTAPAINTASGATISTTGGSVPTITCSGGSTGTSVATGSTNNRGQVTTSSSASTNCTITFNSSVAFPQAPFCQYTDGSGSVTPIAFAADTTSTVSAKFDFASGTSLVVNYMCM
jgi:hypothetical protein